MKTYLRFVFLIVSWWVLAGCSQQQPSVLPTLAPTALPDSLPTATSVPTEAATEVPVIRPTFPATWTPTPELAEQLPEETPLSASSQVQPGVKPTLEVCGPFRDDRDRYDPEFDLGSDVTVAWVPVESATNYRIRLTDENDNEIFFAVTAETSFTFSSDLFESGTLYGWSVYPMDALGQQMCFEAGGELFPQ